EGRVERPVGVVTDEYNVLPGGAGWRGGGLRVADEHDPPVALDGEVQRLIYRRAGADRGRRNAVAAAERRIERAVGVVADEHEIGPGGRDRPAGDENLAVGLQRDARAHLGRDSGASGSDHDAGIS